MSGALYANPTHRVFLAAIAFIETDGASGPDVVDEVTAAGGRVVQTIGHLVLAWFDSVTSCMRCCRALRGASCRAGLSVGDVLLEDGLVHGLPVVAAGRLKDLAQPRQILCTARLANLAGLSREASVPLGEVELKGIDRRVGIMMLR